MTNIQQILGCLVIILLFVLVVWQKTYQRSGKAGEKNTLRLIKNFLRRNNYQKQDYLLIHDFNLHHPKGYWDCQIDILLLTRKWIYVIEVKDWQVGTLRGNFNDEYLELSWKIRKRRRLWRQRVYSPFFQNETHIKRLKSYFSLYQEPNFLSVIVFNSDGMSYNLKRNKQLTLEHKFILTNFDKGRDIADILANYERENTQLTSFEQLREKVNQEINKKKKESRNN